MAVERRAAQIRRLPASCQGPVRRAPEAPNRSQHTCQRRCQPDQRSQQEEERSLIARFFCMTTAALAPCTYSRVRMAQRAAVLQRHICCARTACQGGRQAEKQPLAGAYSTHRPPHKSTVSQASRAIRASSSYQGRRVADHHDRHADATSLGRLLPCSRG